MQFALNPDQRLLKESVERFLGERYAAGPRAYRALPGGYSEENWRGMAALGLLGVPFASADGGLDGGPWELLTVMEALGRSMAVEPVLEEVVAAAGFLARAGEPAQKAQWLPKILSGEAHIALAHFEHAARFSLAGVQVRALPRGAAVTLEGTKSMVPLASTADVWIVSARDEGGDSDSGGIAFYLVAPGASGIERRDFRLTDGSVASSIVFRGAPVMGRLRGGFAEFETAMDVARLAAGAEMVGLMTVLFESTVDYLRTRKQFGAPLSSFQAVQHRLADLYVLLEQSRSQLYRAALAWKAPARAVAGMKSYVSRAAVEVGEACVHLHGGIGMTAELALGFGYKRLLVLASLLGDPDSELTRFLRLAG